MENNFYQKAQLTSQCNLEQELEKDWVQVINLGAGGYEIMHNADEGNPNFFLSPPATLRLLHGFYRKSVPKNRYWKERINIYWPFIHF